MNITRFSNSVKVCHFLHADKLTRAALTVYFKDFFRITRVYWTDNPRHREQTAIRLPHQLAGLRSVSAAQGLLNIL